jgi:hypothetical protein
MSGSAERKNRCREAHIAQNILALLTYTLSLACQEHPRLRLTDDWVENRVRQAAPLIGSTR